MDLVSSPSFPINNYLQLTAHLDRRKESKYWFENPRLPSNSEREDLVCASVSIG